MAVSSFSGNRVHVTDVNGELKYVFGSEGQLNQDHVQLHSPYGIAYDSSGRLLVANYLDSTIAVISPDGSFKGAIELAEFWARAPEPRGIAVNSSGHLFVACHDPDCVVVVKYNITE